VDVLSEVFDFAHVESGRLELQSSPFRMADLLQRIAETVVQRAEKKGLEVLFRATPDVPEYLEGDAHRLYQVLANLIGNAVRFTREGEVVVGIETLERKDASLHLHFSIQDTGIGMSREQVEHLDGFFSAPAEDLSPEAHPDVGLGLALAHMLVHIMGGKIWVESEAEHGSIFHVSLWLKAGVAPRPRTVPLNLLRNMHVLVVDDNSSSRIILSEALRSFGFRVESAESGFEALEMLQQACERHDPYTLVLLDWKMPGLDGVKTAKRIRENPAISTPPQLLMVSASVMVDCTNLRDDAGIYGCLVKPVSRSLLFDTIVRLFAREQGDGPTEDLGAILAGDDGDKRLDDLESLMGARILLVEDNEINQQIAVELLEMVGAVVITANNGKEALDILRQQRVDAVLMDIQMPIMDGLEAARRARELPVPGISSLPILAMTAHAMDSDREKSFKAGMQAHLTKPVEPRQLYAVLSKWVAAGKASAAEAAQSGAALPDGLADVPGLSVQSALKNLGGNQGLYIRLLGRFVESYGHVPQQVSDALAAGDRQLAVRLSHTVKGVAGSLGAFGLASAAGALEEALSAHTDHAALLDEMREVLHQTLESIRSLNVAAPGPEEAVVFQEMNAQRRDAAIAFLRAAPERMITDWNAVQQEVQDFAKLLGHSATASAYADLALAVDEYDADAVQLQAEKIIALLQGTDC
jgi:two-component system sensor histidine kinase/response regulator